MKYTRGKSRQTRHGWKTLTPIIAALSAATAIGAPKPNSMPRPFDAGKCEGTSYFEKAIADSGGKIAGDLAGITEQLQASFKSPLRVAGIDVADSRSLERDHTSLNSLRVLLSVQRLEATTNVNGFGSSGTVLDEDAMSPVFLASAPDAHQVEVQSRVPGKDCYKFLLIEDFNKPGKKARLIQPPRGTCTACHQAGGPIFTHFPWSETSFGGSASGKPISEHRLNLLKKETIREWNKIFGAPKPPVFNDQMSVVDIRTAASAAAGESHANSTRFSELTALPNGRFRHEAKELATYRKQILDRWKELAVKAPDLESATSEFALSNLISEALSKTGTFSSASRKIVDSAKEKAGFGGLRNQSRFGFSTKIQANFDGGFDYDGIVRSASAGLQQQRVCAALCNGKNDLECRKAVLGAAILGATSTRQNPRNGQAVLTANALATLDGRLETALKSSWPEDGFSYPSSVLPDRDPTIDVKKNGVTKLFVVTDPMEFAIQDQGLSSNAKSRELIENLGVPLREKGPLLTYEEDQATSNFAPDTPGIQLFQVTGIEGPSDPKTPRPRIKEIPIAQIAQKIAPFAGKSCLGWTKDDIAKIAAARSSDEAVLELLEDSNVTLLLSKSWPPKANALIPVVVKSLNATQEKANRQLACDDPLLRALTGNGAASITSNQIVAKEIIEPIPAASKDKVLPYFTKYCQECHNAEPSVLPLADLDRLKTYDAAGDSPLSMIQTHEMPPKSAKVPLPEAERALMVRLLSEKPTP